MLIRHEQLKLGKAVKIRLRERPGRSLTVQLEPPAAVKGRLLDADGDPIVGAGVTPVVCPDVGFATQLPPATSDKQAIERTRQIV